MSNKATAYITNGLEVLLPAAFAIAYTFALNGLDGTQCSGTPVQFGVFAKWSQIILIFVSLAKFYCNYYLLNGAGGRDPIARLVSSFRTTLKTTYGILMFIIWIYACIALANRHTCESRGLVDLIWVLVLFPVILLALLCSCVCCVMMVVGTAEPPSRFLANRTRIAEHVELLELRRALQEDARQ